MVNKVDKVPTLEKLKNYCRINKIERNKKEKKKKIVTIPPKMIISECQKINNMK